MCCLSVHRYLLKKTNKHLFCPCIQQYTIAHTNYTWRFKLDSNMGQLSYTIFISLSDIEMQRKQETSQHSPRLNWALKSLSQRPNTGLLPRALSASPASALSKLCPCHLRASQSSDRDAQLTALLTTDAFCSVYQGLQVIRGYTFYCLSVNGRNRESANVTG